MPTPQDVGKKGSKILKLPRFNCFTLAMANKLVVIINSLKVPKIRKILPYEIKFLVSNYSCLQNPWLGGYHPQIPILSSVLIWICWTPPQTKFLGTPLHTSLFYSWKTSSRFQVVNSCSKRNASSLYCFFFLHSATVYKNGIFFGLLLKQFSVNPLKPRVQSYLPFSGIIRSSPYSPRWQGKG